MLSLLLPLPPSHPRVYSQPWPGWSYSAWVRSCHYSKCSSGSHFTPSKTKVFTRAYKTLNYLATSLISSATALPLAHSIRATLASLLSLKQATRSSLRAFVLVVPSVWDIIPANNSLAYSFTSSRSLLKCLFSIRSILTILLDLFPIALIISSYVINFISLHIWFSICSLLLFIVCLLSIKGKLHEDRGFFLIHCVHWCVPRA